MRCASPGITFEVVPETNEVTLITAGSSGFSSLETRRCRDMTSSAPATIGSTVWCGRAPCPPLPFT